MLAGSRFFLDSSIWLAYFFGASAKAGDLIDKKDSLLFTSAISLFEVKKRLLLENISEKNVSSAVDLIKSKSMVVEVSNKICENAAIKSIKLKLPAIDSIIYETALESNAVLVSLDSHFKEKENALIFEE